MHKIKFKCFGDAYWVHKEFFFLACSKNYVTYKDLLDIMFKGKISYEVEINEPIIVGQYEKIGWTKSEGIELVPDKNNTENIDIWYLILPKFEKIEEE